jgi:hypothetical protein
MVTYAAPRPQLRLTRRGRVVLLMVFVLLASLASAVLFTTASRADIPPSGPAPTVVVGEHDTLWAVATRTAGRRDPYAAVAEIQKLNNLPGYVVHPGQMLILPRG